MMRFAAYYGFHYWLQFELAAYNVSRNLARRPMGAWTWPNKPGPPETPHKGCVGRGPN
jgi:hypothetical protein